MGGPNRSRVRVDIIDQLGELDPDEFYTAQEICDGINGEHEKEGVTMALNSMARDGMIELGGSATNRKYRRSKKKDKSEDVFSAKTKPTPVSFPDVIKAVKPKGIVKAMASDSGVEKINRVPAYDALEDLKKKINKPNIEEVSLEQRRFWLDVLERLSLLMDPDISCVLKDISAYIDERA